MKNKKIIVTGEVDFIGSNFIKTPASENKNNCN